MRISVITPCHNAGPWIAAALQSGAQQTYSAHEIIVVNDNSTDNSLAQIEQSGVPVKLLQVNACNAAVARNVGIEAAEGEWIALLDADDIWYPNHLARAVELLSKTKDVAFMSNHDWIGVDDEFLPLPEEFRCKLLLPRSGMDVNGFFQLIRGGFHFGHSTVLYQRDRVREVGMFDPSQRRRHDIDLWLRVIANRSWTYDTVKAVGYRETTPGSLSKDDTECDYFYLRALVKNLHCADGSFYREHLARQARRAMGIALVDGPTEHYARIRELSLPHLPPLYKFFYSCVALWPGTIRRLVKAKRRIMMELAGAMQRPARTGVVSAGCATLAGAMALTLVVPRRRAYHRLLRYDPKQDCVLGCAGPNIETIPVRCDDQGFLLPRLSAGASSGFLELDVRASAIGAVFDPAVDIISYGFHDTQFFERGVCGTRFVNVTRLLAANSWAGGWIKLNGRHLAWRGGSARLHVCNETLSAAERVLVVSPHPDDAEIAAFGLYADTDATVVTLTAGDGSDHYSGTEQRLMHLRRATIAKLRVLDSIATPQLGDVRAERAVNLCFPDGRLRDMRCDPERDFSGESESGLDLASLRRLNRSPLLRDSAACTWKSLVRELSHILMEIKPTIIVAPHPRLDPHSDHLNATAAVCEAIELAGFSAGRWFFYSVHNRRSELWPFGPAGSGVSLLPVFADDRVCAGGFYSHALSTDRQREKFLALEAMHDLREIEWPNLEPLNMAGRRLYREFRGLVHGMGGKPTSYIRRAVRPDELFFVTSLEDGVTLARRALEHRT
jgi:glycosyltransferase involved in cell wall biosynthesis/LmbE family N-acetylglucosaminyl deacetylase